MLLSDVLDKLIFTAKALEALDSSLVDFVEAYPKCADMRHLRRDVVYHLISLLLHHCRRIDFCGVISYDHVPPQLILIFKMPHTEDVPPDIGVFSDDVVAL